MRHLQNHPFFVIVGSVYDFNVVKIECVVLFPCVFCQSSPFVRRVVNIPFVLMNSSFKWSFCSTYICSCAICAGNVVNDVSGVKLRNIAFCWLHTKEFNLDTVIDRSYQNI